MSPLTDARKLTDQQREALALKIHGLPDVLNLPIFQHWNYAMCRSHKGGWDEQVYNPATDGLKTVRVTSRPPPGCQDCGILFRRHQRVGIPWLYYKKRGLLADTTGSGKTTHAGGLLALLKESGELSVDFSKRDKKGRALLCVRAPALLQWATELNRMIPGLMVDVAVGTKAKRLDRYARQWEVMLISPQTLINDADELELTGISTLIVDDVDALRHRDTRTSFVLKRIARRADRFVVMTATPLQKKLHELHSVLECMGGFELFGSQDNFTRRYEQVEQVKVYDPKKGTFSTEWKVVGSRNLGEFREKITPLTLRRTADDFDDVEYPTVHPSNVLLELSTSQRRKYTELKGGVLKILKETGKQTKHVTAMTAIGYGAKICAGLAALGEPDGPGTSVKFDWIMDKLTGDMEDEKVVIFANIKNSVRALSARMTAAGIDHVTVWGEVRGMERHKDVTRFQKDRKCRVLIGTSAIEQSLNLQVARHMINVDLIMNPARMTQLAGRIQRDGSSHSKVFVHNLLTVDTQEERYLPLLEREQALIDAVWGEQSALFDTMSALQLMALITG